MKLDIADEDIPLLIRALDNYAGVRDAAPMEGARAEIVVKQRAMIEVFMARLWV